MSCKTIGNTALDLFNSSIQVGSLTLLKDGKNRQLGYRMYGKGKQIALFFPGNLNSRYFRAAWDQTENIATEMNVRVIQIDRPGVGVSTDYLNCNPTTFSNDVSEFLDILNIGEENNVSLIGFSSGGPWAMTCAARIKRIRRLILVSPDAQYDEINQKHPNHLFNLYGMHPPITEEHLLKKMKENSTHLKESYLNLKQPERKDIAIKDLDEAISQVRFFFFF